MRRLSIKSQTLYKGESLESGTSCDFTIRCPVEKEQNGQSQINQFNFDGSSLSNNQQQRPQIQQNQQNQGQTPRKWEEIYDHDVYLEQIVIWLYLEASLDLTELIIDPLGVLRCGVLTQYIVWIDCCF